MLLLLNIKESPGSHQHQGEGSQRKLQERFNDVAITATRNRSSTTEKLVGDQVDQCDITSSVNTFKQTIDHLPSCKNSALHSLTQKTWLKGGSKSKRDRVQSKDPGGR